MLPLVQRKNKIIPWACVFKVTFPNKKIYIGSDTAKTAQEDFFKYFGTPSHTSKTSMFDDLGEYLQGDIPYSLRKELLFVKENVTVREILSIEQKFINQYDAKHPNIGYNK